jgi:SAM-dependent methyltransferase
MSKFVDLVRYRLSILETKDSLYLDDSVDEKKHLLLSVGLNNPRVDYNTRVDYFINQYYELLEKNHNMVAEVDRFIKDIENDLDNLASTVFTDQHTLDESLLGDQSIDPPKEILELIHTRIGTHCNWLYPALSIYPRENQWINCLVSNDPLYLLHPVPEQLNKLISGYSQLYQNRLRPYNSVEQLPQAQFSFVLAWDLFNYISLNRINQYISDVFPLLRPGGVFMFSYNNCDLEGPARRAEFKASSYANYRIILNYAISLGYELVVSENIATGDVFNPYVSWIELRKPGQLNTVKAHQAVAKIIEN